MDSVSMEARTKSDHLRMRRSEQIRDITLLLHNSSTPIQSQNA